MANVFIEARPKRRAGAKIEDYVVEEQNSKVLKVCKTQLEAIEWAKANGHRAHVARVRTTQRDNPDHWRRI
jgi:hypothetical protein